MLPGSTQPSREIRTEAVRSGLDCAQGGRSLVDAGYADTWRENRQWNLRIPGSQTGLQWHSESREVRHPVQHLRVAGDRLSERPFLFDGHNVRLSSAAIHRLAQVSTHRLKSID